MCVFLSGRHRRQRPTDRGDAAARQAAMFAGCVRATRRTARCVRTTFDSNAIRLSVDYFFVGII